MNITTGFPLVDLYLIILKRFALNFVNVCTTKLSSVCSKARWKLSRQHLNANVRHSRRRYYIAWDALPTLVQLNALNPPREYICHYKC